MIKKILFLSALLFSIMAFAPKAMAYTVKNGHSCEITIRVVYSGLACTPPTIFTATLAPGASVTLPSNSCTYTTVDFEDNFGNAWRYNIANHAGWVTGGGQMCNSTSTCFFQILGGGVEISHCT